MRPQLLALLLAASSGCRAPQVEGVATVATPAATPERPDEQPDEQPPAPEPPAAACRLHVRSSDFGLDCASWRASLDELASRHQPGSQPYVDVVAWREHLVAFEAAAIPRGAQLDHVYLDLYTRLDELVIGSAEAPERLRVPDVGLLGLQVDADVELQVVLDVINTATVAELERVEILDEVGHASASLHLSLHTGPLTTDGLRVLGGGPHDADTAQTWPALVEQLAQPLAQSSGPGVELRLASKRERPPPSLPNPSPPPRQTHGTWGHDPEAARRRMTDAAVVRILELTTEGDEHWRESVAAHFRNHLEEVEIDYYRCGLRDDPKLAGELALNVAIGTRGQVVVLQIAEHSESLSWPFIDCLTRRMRSWHIYRRGESVVVAHLSLRLQPKKP